MTAIAQPKIPVFIRSKPFAGGPQHDSQGHCVLESLNIPAEWQSLLQAPAGLLLLTGPVSSGKTLTAGASLDYVNRVRVGLRILSADVPQEVFLNDKGCTIERVQGLEPPGDHGQALRADGEVVFLGDLRTGEDALHAVAQASLGRLVVATLYTSLATSYQEQLLRLVGSSGLSRIEDVLLGVLVHRLEAAAFMGVHYRVLNTILWPHPRGIAQLRALADSSRAGLPDEVVSE